MDHGSDRDRDASAERKRAMTGGRRSRGTLLRLLEHLWAGVASMRRP
eukprot:CAMPEP_0117606164 /NCGR_PEP_ID=MMETSP0784-20121206/79572_1 /TAXON_ID=39447 /ORGANISM="" /LENGTH=46 /DNA_ID= /DNA_START= /DNA_END= /DNA_ORIENTATION=